jgi:hypothetical protein
MWIPSNFTTTVCFLCINNGEKMLYCGTAFFVMVGEAEFPDASIGYLVTAKHCICKAFDQYGNLSCRLNKKDGGVKFFSLPSLNSQDWFLSDDADVAVFEFPDDDSVDYSAIPSMSFLTDELVQNENIGIGDEVFLIGLFNLAHGRERNFPVVRSGMIASMQNEPFRDSYTGNDYRAFLIEVRSIGGLSGSPVFMALQKRGMEMHPAPRGFNFWTHSLILIGLIRGHWDMYDQDFLPDSGIEKMEKLNTGIAIVTPIREVEKVLMSDELRKIRKAHIRAYQKDHQSTR